MQRTIAASTAWRGVAWRGVAWRGVAGGAGSGVAGKDIGGILVPRFWRADSGRVCLAGGGGGGGILSPALLHCRGRGRGDPDT